MNFWKENLHETCVVHWVWQWAVRMAAFALQTQLWTQQVQLHLLTSCSCHSLEVKTWKIRIIGSFWKTSSSIYARHPLITEENSIQKGKRVQVKVTTCCNEETFLKQIISWNGKTSIGIKYFRHFPKYSTSEKQGLHKSKNSYFTWKKHRNL